jgi:tetratricopeptide (TPR) repeat protein
LGSYSAAVKSYETAAALCDPDCLSRVEHKLGDLHQRRGDWELSESHYQVALEALEERNDVGERARLYADWALTALQREQNGLALEQARRALDLAEQTQDRRALAQAHNMLGICAMRRFRGGQPPSENSLALPTAWEIQALGWRR